MKFSLLSTLLALVLALGFLGTQVLAATPAELAEETVTAEERDEQGARDSASRRGQSGGKKTKQLFTDAAAFVRFTLESYPGNIHLLQVFRV